MRFRGRICLGAVALAVAAALLGGCGGGSNPAARKLHAVLSSECGSGLEIEEKLRGLVAGVLATEREFESSGSGEDKSQVLQGMKENIAAIHRELRPMEDCTRNVLRRREGKPALHPESTPPRRGGTVIAHRVGSETFEPGGDEKSASPCGQIGEHGVARVYVVPHWSNCLRVPPGDRLAIVDTREFSPPGGSVQVTIGGYEVWLAPGQEGVIPGRIGSYLGEGSHHLGAIGTGFGSLIIVEPEAGG
jgi:hypothetical protein